MGLWNNFKIKTNIKANNSNIFFHYEKGIDKELRQQYIAFARWLRKNYRFPVRVNVYIVNSEKIELLNGNLAYGSFRWYKNRPPIIKIPSAITRETNETYSKEDIYYSILSSLVHEITHYFQWITYSNQNDNSSERQANYYRFRILDLYNKNTSIK